MSPPLSHVERGSAPPRRKSCLACVKSKRRCDQRLPSCLRCAQRQITCDYPARVSRSNRTQPNAEARPTAHLASRHNGGHASSRDKPTYQDSWTTADELIAYPDCSWPDDHEPGRLVEGLALAPETTQQWPSMMPFRDIPLFEEIADDPEFTFHGLVNNMASPQTTPALQVTHTGYFNIEAINVELDSTLSYAVEKIQSAPGTMLHELQTPWCHVFLYKDEMPQVIQDALAACALYASKSSVNGPVIMRCIDAKVHNLLASHIPTEFLHALARVQALLIYQTIRFFDGDILARSSADATINELRSSAHVLAGHIKWDLLNVLDGSIAGSETSLFPVQASRPIWKAWVLQESARRTYLIACFFMKVWKLLTGRQVPTCRADPVLLSQSWTLSAKLWQASDAFDFAVAWREGKHYVVRRKEILSTLADADGDDIETFGKMLLTVAMGVEEAKAWLASKGASL